MLFNEPKLLKYGWCKTGGWSTNGFSALQRAEIAEIEPKQQRRQRPRGFSALQRAEIAEMLTRVEKLVILAEFQCSSTSRNC